MHDTALSILAVCALHTAASVVGPILLSYPGVVKGQTSDVKQAEDSMCKLYVPSLPHPSCLSALLLQLASGYLRPPYTEPLWFAVQVIPQLQGDATEQTPPDLPSYLFKERIVYLVSQFDQWKVVPSCTHSQYSYIMCHDRGCHWFQQSQN